ncbi:MAG: zinc ribbon domain-containing protein [Verrucomicrobia bacterium]|nr:zinc ribbon domain-containing protein [Verrucomicrobiota bacterium]
MPTYEYACPKCGHEFEQFKSMLDAPLKKCPKCKKTGLKRLVGGGAGLIFKGTGFYITDYKTKKGTPHTDSAPAAKPATESKPAPAPAAAPSTPAKRSSSAKK